MIKLQDSLITNDQLEKKIAFQDRKIDQMKLIIKGMYMEIGDTKKKIKV